MRPRKAHWNSLWCHECAELWKERPAHRLTPAQIRQVRSLLFKMPREKIAETVGVSISNLKRWARDEGIRLAYFNKWAANPALVKEIIAYYGKHGKIETEKRYPGVRVRSVVEHYGRGLRMRQVRWTDQQLVELARMAGLVSPEAQARHFDRPRANGGSISAAWIKKFGLNGGRVNGIHWHTARYFVRPACPTVATAFWTTREKRIQHNRPRAGQVLADGREIVLWVDFERYLRAGVPGHLREAAAAMARFQRWLHGTDHVRARIGKMIRELEKYE